MHYLKAKIKIERKPLFVQFYIFCIIQITKVRFFLSLVLCFETIHHILNLSTLFVQNIYLEWFTSLKDSIIYFKCLYSRFAHFVLEYIPNISYSTFYIKCHKMILGHCDKSSSWQRRKMLINDVIIATCCSSISSFAIFHSIKLHIR